MGWFRRIFIRLKIIFKWLPIIFKDYQFDHHYFYIVLRHKLRLMEEFFRSENAWSVKATSEADKIKKCILLLDRLIKNDYYDLAGFDKIDKKWGEPEWETFPMQDPPGYYTLNSRRRGIITPKDKKQFDREFDICHRREVMLEKQDKEYLFKLISKNIDGWWD